MQQEELPVVFGRKKKLFQVVVRAGSVQSRPDRGTPTLIKLSHRGAALMSLVSRVVDDGNSWKINYCQ